MKISKRCLLSLLTLLSVVYVNAQTADEIISRHIDAMGGKEKLSSITSLRMEHTVEVMGNESPATTTILNGKGYRYESEFNDMKIVQVYTTQGGWAINFGSPDPQAMPDAQYKSGQDQIYIAPFLDYVSRGGKAELLGKEKVGNVEAYKIKFTNSSNAETTYYFDPATNYIVQMVRTGDMMGQQITITSSFSDFRKTDAGLVVPYQIDISFGDQFSLTLKVKKVEVNQPVDAAIFEMKK